MTFTPRTFSEITSDMLNYISARTGLTDGEIGAIIKSLAEAAGLEADEAYYQMVQLMDAFVAKTAAGSDLDERAADDDLVRMPPRPAVGEVVIADDLLPHSTLLADMIVGVDVFRLVSSASLPVAGYPYTLRLGEGTVEEEDVSVTSNDPTTGTIHISSTTQNPHLRGELAVLVRGDPDRQIQPGQIVRRPVVGSASSADYVTVETGVHADGYLRSSPIRIVATVPGTNGNSGSQEVNTFAGTPPYPSASVVNLKPVSGGRGLETDAEFRDRLRYKRQTLSAGTPLAVRESVRGQADEVTGQTVTSVSLREVFSGGDEVQVFVDDGTGFVPEQVALVRSVLDGFQGATSATLKMRSVADLPGEGYLLVNPESVSLAELVQFSSVDYAAKTATLASATTKSHNDGSLALQVDLIEPSAEEGRRFLTVQKSPLVRGSIRIWVNSGGGFVEKTLGVDFVVNRGTGQVEFMEGLSEGAIVVAYYSYFTGLVRTLHQILDGVEASPATYPGVRSAGIQASVEAATPRPISVRIAITALPGYQESSLRPVVKDRVESYFSALKVAEDVIHVRIGAVAIGVPGVENAKVIEPAGDVTIRDNERAVAYDSDGASKVVVV